MQALRKSEHCMQRTRHFLKVNYGRRPRQNSILRMAATASNGFGSFRRLGRHRRRTCICHYSFIGEHHVSEIFHGFPSAALAKLSDISHRLCRRKCSLSLAPFIDKASLFRSIPSLHAASALVPTFRAGVANAARFEPSSNTLPCEPQSTASSYMSAGNPFMSPALSRRSRLVFRRHRSRPRPRRSAFGRHEYRCRTSHQRDERPECFHEEVSSRYL